MKQALAPLSAAICVPIAAVVAYLLDADVLLAAAGAGLVLLYWAFEAGAVALGSRGSFNRAIGFGVGGMIVRLAVVLGLLAVVGMLTSKPDTLTCIAAFIGTFTVYFVVRLTLMPFQLKAGDGSSPGAPLRRERSSGTGDDEPEDTLRRATQVGTARHGTVHT